MPRRPSSINAPKRSSSNVRRTIGANIKARRLTLGWSQQELADRFGVSRATVSQYEIGTGEVNAGDLPRLAEILGAGLLDFYGNPPPVYALPPLSEYSLIPEAKSSRESDGERLRPENEVPFIALFDNNARTVEYIGPVADPAERPRLISLLESILSLSPDNQETVRRVVDAMSGGATASPQNPDPSKLGKRTEAENVNEGL